jgi:murein DD-endopeptidase MepM/ murein hydrolase activator NlpD
MIIETRPTPIWGAVSNGFYVLLATLGTLLTGCVTLPATAPPAPTVCPRGAIPAQHSVVADANVQWVPEIDVAGISEAVRVIGKRGAEVARQAHKSNAPVCPRPLIDVSPSMEPPRQYAAEFASNPVCPRPVGKRPMCWPVMGSVSRGFDDDADHRGVDICAPEGSAIVAASDGKVLYAGDKLSGFGQMVIIDHGGDLATVYAHNRRNLVRVGDQVSRGQVIGEVGSTGNATAPHCHFEIRSNAKPINPLLLLPEPPRLIAQNTL